MKVLGNLKGYWLIVIATVAIVIRGGTQTDSSEPLAEITSVRLEKTNVVVEVRASSSLIRVTLESSTRVGRRVWEPRAVHHLDPGTEVYRTFTFTLPQSASLEILRVRGDLSDPLPSSFYLGTNEFVANLPSGGTTGAATGGALQTGAPGNTAPTTDALDSGNRSVVESDIWTVSGDILYFFNQYRGLQIIDISNPDSPVVTGTYDLAAAGEQMYLLDTNKVVLLAHDNCAWYGDENQSKVILLNIENGKPVLARELGVPGSILESRMVGTALYVTADSYQQKVLTDPTLGGATSVSWIWGTYISSYDLSDFQNASAKSSAWVEGYGNTIYASERHLFVAHYDYLSSSSTYATRIHIYDISDPNGTLQEKSEITVNGLVNDKFKMNENGNVFSVVTQEWNPRRTMLRTFSLEDPLKPLKLADLVIIENEQLFATRFSGNILYAVTFFVIDPLWIIDLSNPGAPKKVGELQIPGWSTYLNPMGNQLLAIGLDRTNGYQRTSVQLFDVADPAKPSLLSKVLIGDQWSGSEANWDEKAFGVLPDEHLVLVPFYSSGSSGYSQGVQLIDLESDHLTKRGVITQNMAARRTTVHKNRILSLSSRELLTVDATDRDNPVPTKTTELSWAADDVHLVGNHLIEVDAYRSEGPVLRVVSAEDPAIVFGTAALTNLPYLGSTVVGSQLFVLQGRSREVIYPQIYNPTNWYPIGTNEAVLVCSAYSLSNLPELPLSGRAEKSPKDDSYYYYGKFKALQVKPGLLVWANSGGGYPIYWLRGGGPVDVVAGPVGPALPTALAAGASDAAIGGGIAAPIWWWWGGGGSGRLIAVDTSSISPEIVSETTIGSPTNSWWNFSDAYTANGLFYTSHLSTEFDPNIDPPPYASQYYDQGKLLTVTNDPPPGAWVQKYYLDVVDFADPTDPLVRKPVNVPGSLIGVHRSGEVVYTRGYDYVPFVYSGNEFITASAYDGASASLLDTLTLSSNWPKPALADQGYIYLGSTTNQTNSTLQVWTLGNNGKFAQISDNSLKQPIQQFAKFGDLLVAQTDQIQLYNAAEPAALHLIGSGDASTCYGINIDAADGDVTRGVWIPMGWYGVVKIPVGASEN